MPVTQQWGQPPGQPVWPVQPQPPTLVKKRNVLWLLLGLFQAFWALIFFIGAMTTSMFFGGAILALLFIAVGCGVGAFFSFRAFAKGKMVPPPQLPKVVYEDDPEKAAYWRAQGYTVWGRSKP